MGKIFAKPILHGILVLCVLALLSSCTKKQNNAAGLVKINGLLYKSGSNVPYTGREKARVSDRIIEYDVSNGVKNGEFKILYSDGKPQIVGQMVNGKNEGVWKYYYVNSAIESEGSFKDDMPDGVWTWYYQDGKVREQGKYVSGKKNGNWITYEASGKISIENKFKDGKIVVK
jgi:antitoxin component YwqK of YwqJK toxin-antitoxin module